MKIDNFDSNIIKLFDQIGEPVYFEKGINLITEGEQLKHIFLLIYGRCQVFLPLLNCEKARITQSTLAYLGEGSLIGEMNFIDGLKASASVQAITDVKCLKIDSKILAAHLENNHKDAASFYRSVSQDLTYKVRANNKKFDY